MIMPQIDVHKAIQFIEATNDPVLSTLAKYVVGQRNTEQVIDILKTYQRSDGGWTKTDKDMLGDVSAISTTWVGLQWLLWVGGAGSPQVDRTVDFLRRTQRDNGAWDEPEEVRQFNPPWYMLPGRYENQLWLTSAVCCKLKELGREKDVQFDNALDFLRQGWDGQRFPVFIHPHWMAMALFYLQNTGSKLDQEIIIGCERFLYTAIKDDKVDPGDNCAIAYASLMAKGAADDLYQLSLQNALNNQMEDGGWKTNYRDKHRVSFTIDALFLLKKIGME
jgi:hypothetical protein